MTVDSRTAMRRMMFVSLLIAVAAALRLLTVADWDPTAFTAFGEEAVEITDYAEAKLGREVKTRILQGHDGKFFFVLANDPLVLDPAENAAVLDRPIYRSQRMLYPLLAGGAGLFSPEVIVWTLILINVAGLVVGSWAVGAIAVKHGLSPWWGLAFLFNVGLLSELYIDGAGIVAFALACLGALALEYERPGWGAAFFAGAALTREVMLAFVGSVALVWLIRKKAIPWLVAVPAGVAALVWAAYLRIQIPATPGVDQVREITLVPFSGLMSAFTSGMATLSDFLVMGLFVMLMLVVPWRARTSNVYLTWGAVGFAVLAPFLTMFVWQKSYDISRALAPLVTAFLIEFALARRRRPEHMTLDQALT
jgi:hypothetical protein